MPDERFPRDEQLKRFGFCWDDIPSFGEFMDFWSFSEKVVRHAPHGSIVCETGSYHGRSIICLGLFAREANKGLKLFSIDNNDIGGSPTLKNNIVAAGLESIITIIDKPSLEAVKDFADESVWLCFLDDDHQHHAVEAGCRAWMPKIQTFGWLSGHDALWYTVAEPVHALFGVENVITEHIDIWIVPKMTPRNGVDIRKSSYRPEVIPGSWKP